MVLDSFAHGDAACNHGLVICEVKHEKVSFVAKNLGNGKGSFLSDPTVSQMQICQSLIVFNTLS